ncbi:zinc finger protein, putative [Plasmodium gallinaceum]|uniref:Zinc finger protein, putative n=1 Tax=Plasmodium gallinaceum TaxID=5849 RepID=A0A1J1GNS8_PLAGA|nr:zinc finger protein, putative [Plasmodium gallinaceum]CRG93942.1 zinc finger protein, putative [Plasmodium gallinaceum]
MSVTLRQHFWKTKLCPLHMENRCKEGNNCDYAHSIEDLRSIPDLKRTKLCYKLLKGEKCFNKKCNYAHNQDELKSAQNLFAYKSSMCKFVANNTCLNGSTCRFAHSIDELRIPRIPDILLEKNTQIDMQNNLTCIDNNVNKINNNGNYINKDNSNNYNNNNNNNNNNDSFNKNLDTMINNFNALNLMNEYNNANIMKNINNNYVYKNNGVNHKGEKKRKEKIRNKNKDKQLKLKNFNYNKNENDFNKDINVINSTPNKHNDQRERTFDSNTTISSSLNYMGEEKNKINETNISNTYERVDLNQCYGKTEENISNFSEKHINDTKTKGNKSKNKKKNNKNKDRSEGKNRENSEMINNMNYTNNSEYINGMENQINYLDYNYANNFPNTLLYSKIPIKLNTFNPYFNYNQLNSKMCKNEANMSNQYSQYIKPNEFLMYDHQNNIPYMPTNYYANYLYYYPNSCNYGQFAMIDKVNNNMSCENINYNKSINKSIINKTIHEIKETDEGIEEINNKKKGYKEVIDDKVNYEQTYSGEMNSEEINDENINDEDVNEEIYYSEINEKNENDEDINEDDAQDKVINDEEMSDEEMSDEETNDEKTNNEETNDEKIKDEEVGEGDIDEDDELSVDYVNGDEEIHSNENNIQKIYENDINYEGNTRGNNYEYNSKEIKEKRGNIEGNKYSYVRKITNNNVNNIMNIEYGVNTNMNDRKNEENKKKNSNFLSENDLIKHKENIKQMNTYNKRENKQNKKKMSRLVTLNNKKKSYKKEIYMNNQEYIDYQRNNRNISIENVQESKPYVNPSSVYSYIVNANPQNINYEKNIMKPLSNDMELYINKQYPINPLANDPMVYNLNNRNYGYYYCAYPPSTFNDEVYLN